jgi:hypothetical protein
MAGEKENLLRTAICYQIRKSVDSPMLDNYFSGSGGVMSSALTVKAAGFYQILQGNILNFFCCHADAPSY